MPTRVADLVFKMAARAMADEYADEEEAVFPPHVGLKHHNVYYRTLNRNTTSRGRDGTAFNLMKLPHAKVTAGQEN